MGATEVWAFLEFRFVFVARNAYPHFGRRTFNSDTALFRLALRSERSTMTLAVGNDPRSCQGLLEPSAYRWATKTQSGETYGLHDH